MFKQFLIFLSCVLVAVRAFSGPASPVTRSRQLFGATRNHITRSSRSVVVVFASEESSGSSATTSTDDETDPMEEAMMEMDEQTREALAKQRRADELRAQEVFMKKSTGKWTCTNCDWMYDETKGDAMMIGGMVKPDTPFGELPNDWRCPVCRASKDSFVEVVEEIPGFEVNQGYGFGTNSWTAEQKNLAVFGGLGLFFLLFLSGYALN